MHAFNHLKHADSPPKWCFQARKVQLLGVKFDFSCPVFTYLPPACLLIFSRLNICKCRFKGDFLEKKSTFHLTSHLLTSIWLRSTFRWFSGYRSAVPTQKTSTLTLSWTWRIWYVKQYKAKSNQLVWIAVAHSAWFKNRFRWCVSSAHKRLYCRVVL